MAAHLVVVLHKNLRTRALQVNEVAKPCSAIKDEKEHQIKKRRLCMLSNRTEFHQLSTFRPFFFLM